MLDRVVSKEHAVIERAGNETVVRDVGSRNGTFVNGHRIAGEYVLADGDEVSVGSTRLRYHADPVVPERNDGRTRTMSRVTILDTGQESAIRSRLKETGTHRFDKADVIDDMAVLRRDYEKLRVANELSQVISTEFDIETLLNRILEHALQVFNADRGVILLMNEDTGELDNTAVLTKHGNQDEDIRISSTILAEVVEERTALLSNDAQMDSRFSGAHSIMLEGIRATMSVPLMADNDLLGVIHLDTQFTADVFTEKDLQLLTGFAQQAANSINYSRMVRAREQQALARERLGRLLPAEVVDAVMRGDAELERGGELRDATVLFADIRGFTALSEREPAPLVVDLLNEYFERMVEIVFRHGGMLDKFIGDEIMAVWGAHIDTPTHAMDAVNAALEMQAALLDFNRERADHGLRPVLVGVGINSGELVAGYMGSSQAMDYTVIGDPVNVAARLCSAAPANEILVSRELLDRCGGRVIVEQLPPQELKGKSTSVDIFRVNGIRDA